MSSTTNLALVRMVLAGTGDILANAHDRAPKLTTRIQL